MGTRAWKLPTDVMNGFSWELYNIDKDWTQANNLPTQMPDKLRALPQLFTLEGAKYRVFPLDDSTLTRFLSVKPNYAANRTVFTYYGELTNVPFPGSGGAPSLLDRSHTITAEIDIPQGGAEGMLVTDGGRFGGYGFYLLKGRPVFAWNLVQLERVKWQGKQALAPGKHTLVFDWKYDGPGMGKSGTRTLSVDGQVLDRPSHEQEYRNRPLVDRHIHVGIDTGTPVDDYAVPFKFIRKINKLTIKVGPNERGPEEKEKISREFRDKQ